MLRLKEYLSNRLSESEIVEFQDKFIENIDNPELDNLLMQHLFPQKKKPMVLKFARVAAIVLLVVSSCIWVWNKHETTELTRNEMAVVVTDKGSCKTLLLPDSTEIVLYPESRLSFNKTFSGKFREVWIDGEAHLKVTENPSRKFVVHCQNMDIKVLGTVFNVSSYETDSKAKVTLYKGKIVAESRYNNQLVKREMIPGDHIIIDKQTGSCQLCKVPAIINEGSENMLFINEKLGDIIKTLERRYNVKIEIEDSVDRKDMKIYAIFINGEGLIEMLKNFSTAARTRLIINN